VPSDDTSDASLQIASVSLDRCAQSGGSALRNGVGALWHDGSSSCDDAHSTSVQRNYRIPTSPQYRRMLRSFGLHACNLRIKMPELRNSGSAGIAEDTE
jgi:hypothetical protein